MYLKISRNKISNDENNNKINLVDDMALHYDNMIAISVATSKALNGKRRNIRLRHKVVKELLENGVTSLDFVESEKNLGI